MVGRSLTVVGSRYVTLCSDSQWNCELSTVNQAVAVTSGPSRNSATLPAQGGFAKDSDDGMRTGSDDGPGTRNSARSSAGRVFFEMGVSPDVNHRFSCASPVSMRTLVLLEAPRGPHDCSVR